MTRIFTRVPVHIEVAVRTPDDVEVRGVLRDLSINGLSIDTDAKIAHGARCAVRLLLGTGNEPIPVDAQAVVVRSAERMLALRIESVDPEGYEHFHNLVLYNAPNADAFERELEEYADEEPGIGPAVRN